MTPTCPPPIELRSRGFTLIELLVVLAIVGLLAAVAMPQLRMKPSYAQRARLISELTLRFNEASRQAQLGGQAVDVELPVVDGKKPRFVAAVGQGAAPRFFPDGSSNGGVVRIGDIELLRISWLDGGVLRAAR